jgi:lipopolysaccharide transport system permease protein
MAGRIPGLDDPLAYALFLMSGIFTWGYLADVVQRSQTVFIDHANLIKKADFPRACLPAAAWLSATLSFSIVFLLFLVFLVAIGRFPGSSILAFLPLLAVQQALVIGLGVVLGTLNVFFRDVSHATGIGLQLWFWLTPIVYPLAILPEGVQHWIRLNPLTPVVLGFQDAVLAGRWPAWSDLAAPVVLAVGALVAGWAIFRRLAGELADEL